MAEKKIKKLVAKKDVKKGIFDESSTTAGVVGYLQRMKDSCPDKGETPWYLKKRAGIEHSIKEALLFLKEGEEDPPWISKTSKKKAPEKKDPQKVTDVPKHLRKPESGPRKRKPKFRTEPEEFHRSAPTVKPADSVAAERLLARGGSDAERLSDLRRDQEFASRQDPSAGLPELPSKPYGPSVPLDVKRKQRLRARGGYDEEEDKRYASFSDRIDREPELTGKPDEELEDEELPPDEESEDEDPELAYERAAKEWVENNKREMARKAREAAAEASGGGEVPDLAPARSVEAGAGGVRRGDVSGFGGKSLPTVSALPSKVGKTLSPQTLEKELTRRAERIAKAKAEPASRSDTYKQELMKNRGPSKQKMRLAKGPAGEVPSKLVQPLAPIEQNKWTSPRTGKVYDFTGFSPREAGEKIEEIVDQEAEEVSTSTRARGSALKGFGKGLPSAVEEDVEKFESELFVQKALWEDVPDEEATEEGEDTFVLAQKIEKNPELLKNKAFVYSYFTSFPQEFVDEAEAVFKKLGARPIRRSSSHQSRDRIVRLFREKDVPVGLILKFVEYYTTPEGRLEVKRANADEERMRIVAGKKGERAEGQSTAQAKEFSGDRSMAIAATGAADEDSGPAGGLREPYLQDISRQAKPSIVPGSPEDLRKDPHDSAEEDWSPEAYVDQLFTRAKYDLHAGEEVDVRKLQKDASVKVEKIKNKINAMEEILKQVEKSRHDSSDISNPKEIRARLASEDAAMRRIENYKKDLKKEEDVFEILKKTGHLGFENPEGDPKARFTEIEAVDRLEDEDFAKYASHRIFSDSGIRSSVPKIIEIFRKYTRTSQNPNGITVSPKVIRKLLNLHLGNTKGRKFLQNPETVEKQNPNMSKDEKKLYKIIYLSMNPRTIVRRAEKYRTSKEGTPDEKIMALTAALNDELSERDITMSDMYQGEESKNFTSGLPEKKEKERQARRAALSKLKNPKTSFDEFSEREKASREHPEGGVSKYPGMTRPDWRDERESLPGYGETKLSFDNRIHKLSANLEKFKKRREELKKQAFEKGFYGRGLSAGHRINTSDSQILWNKADQIRDIIERIEKEILSLNKMRDREEKLARVERPRDDRASEEKEEVRIEKPKTAKELFVKDLEKKKKEHWKLNRDRAGQKPVSDREKELYDIIKKRESLLKGKNKIKTESRDVQIEKLKNYYYNRLRSENKTASIKNLKSLIESDINGFKNMSIFEMLIGPDSGDKIIHAKTKEKSWEKAEPIKKKDFYPKLESVFSRREE